MTSSAWTRATRKRPCVVCEGVDNCEWSRDLDGVVHVWCGRVPSDRQNDGGQHYHRIGERPERPTIEYRPRLPRTKRAQDYSYVEKFYVSRLEETERAWLAENLGVSVESLRSLGIGFDRTINGFTCPERDASRNTVGFATRLRDGSKKQVPGGSRGLTFAQDWDHGDGPILLPEGMSDVAALLTINLNAVGRPSCTGGFETLVDLLADVPVNRPIIVVAERDRRAHESLNPSVRQAHDPECSGCRACWPGKWGAARTAKRLAEFLDRPVEWAFPPSGKDARRWLQSQAKPWPDDLADVFLAGLKRHAFQPPTAIAPDVVNDEERAAAWWRETLLQTRLASLGCPGFYLDTSGTGSGKSTVDYLTLEFAITGSIK